MQFRRYGWFSVAAFICLLTLTFDLWPWPLTFDLVCNIARGTDNFPALWCLCDFSSSNYGQTRVKMWRDDVTTLTFDLLTLKPVHNVTRGTDNLPVNFDVSATFRCRIMGKHASHWLRDVITLTFDLWGQCACSVIPVPRLKFVGLPFPKLWWIFRLSSA